MNKLIIEGIPSYDGTHEFEDFASFTNRELHRIKKMTGLRVGEFDEAFQVGDNDLLVALAVVILERNGQEVADDLLWDAEAGSFRFEFAEDEAEDPTKEEAPKAGADSNARTSDSPDSSGNGSNSSSERPENDPSRTGAQPLLSSVTSDPETLAS